MRKYLEFIFFVKTAQYWKQINVRNIGNLKYKTEYNLPQGLTLTSRKLQMVSSIRQTTTMSSMKIPLNLKLGH